MTSDFIHEEISYTKRFQSWTIMDYHELSLRGGVMTGMDDWHG